MRMVRLGAGDVPSIDEVFRAAVAGTEGAPYSPEQVAVWAAGMSTARLAHSVATTTFVGAVDDGGVLLGFANLVDLGSGAGELDLLYVQPATGGRGVARALVAEIERLAIEAGMESIRVDASLLAAPVLEHLGYQVERRYDKEVRGVTFANAWLRRSLRRAPTA